MSENADVVVVGGGIIGCSVVHSLAQLLPRTTRILLLDRGPIAGATSGSCMGHLMVTPSNAQDYSFSRSSVKMWGELAERVGGFHFNPSGALYLADTDEDCELLPVLRSQFEQQGDRCEIVDAAGLREIEPGLAEDIPGALYYAGDGVVLPMLACGVMLREAKRYNENVEVRSDCAVIGFDRSKDRIAAVCTARGKIHTETVVNATGVWAPDLAEMLGQPRLPIFPRAGNLAITGHHVSPIRTQLLEVSYLRLAHGSADVDPAGSNDPGGHALNMQPQSYGSCLIGSTRQFRGMNKTLNRELLHQVLVSARRYVPGIGAAPIVRTWVGLRPYSIDGHPLIGPWPHLDGLWVAAGHEGLGISMAPITGLLLAQQIAGQDPAIDHSPYLPARFVS